MESTGRETVAFWKTAIGCEPSTMQKHIFSYLTQQSSSFNYIVEIAGVGQLMLSTVLACFYISKGLSVNVVMHSSRSATIFNKRINDIVQRCGLSGCGAILISHKINEDYLRSADIILTYGMNDKTADALLVHKNKLIRFTTARAFKTGWKIIDGNMHTTVVPQDADMTCVEEGLVHCSISLPPTPVPPHLQQQLKPGMSFTWAIP